MTTRKIIVALTLITLVLVGCGADGPVAQNSDSDPELERTARPTFTPMPTITNTVPPTLTPEPTPTPVPSTPTSIPPTETPPPPTETPLPTVVPPTATPVPPTSTPVPPAPTARPPTATKAPPAPTKAPQAQHVVGAHGISGLVVVRDKTTFAVGEKAFFIYEALNHTANPVNFVKLGIKASNGQFNTSWINPDVIVPNVPFKHDDGLTFTSPGTYQVMLAICFARCDEGDADWEEFPKGAATITVN